MHQLFSTPTSNSNTLIRWKNNINITKMFQCYKCPAKTVRIHPPLPNKLVHMREGAVKYGRRTGTVLSRTWSIQFFMVICSKEAVLLRLSTSWIEQTKWWTSVSSAFSTNKIFCFESLFCSKCHDSYSCVWSLNTTAIFTFSYETWHTADPALTTKGEWKK